MGVVAEEMVHICCALDDQAAGEIGETKMCSNRKNTSTVVEVIVPEDEEDTHAFVLGTVL